jgi:hypothetical protein
MNVLLFENTLRDMMPQFGTIDTREEMDRVVEEITTALQIAIVKSTLVSRITPRSVLGFTDECRYAIDEAKGTQRRWKRSGLEEDLIEFQQAKQHRKSAISKANRDLHRAKVSEVKEEKDLWSLARWARNRGAESAAFTPDIERSDGPVADDIQGKADALQEVFFPKPPEADLSDIPGFYYNQPAEGWVPIVEREVQEAIRTVPPDKAPGEDEIVNRVLKVAAEIISAPIMYVFNRSVRLSYVPQAFKRSITIALRKQGKDDYSKPKSYRPIVLMNTLGKVLDTIIAKCIQYLAEKGLYAPSVAYWRSKAYVMRARASSGSREDQHSVEEEESGEPSPTRRLRSL